MTNADDRCGPPAMRPSPGSVRLLHDRYGAPVSAAAVSEGQPWVARAAPLGAASDVAAQDLELLFSAIRERLHLAATVPLPEGLGSPGITRLRDIVGDCLSALHQLQQTTQRELTRRQQLEREVFDARTALLQARSELDGVHAGERRARHLALHDGLTSLPNRDHFHERLAKALVPSDRRRMPLAVLYLDLDGLKLVNDAHGHSAGDELLCVVAARLARNVRAGDLVGRLGGDEFACLLADTLDRRQLSLVACKLFDAVSEPFTIGAVRLMVRPSIGIAVCPDDGATTDALIRSADKAMYRAKREQTGYAFFDREIDTV